MSRREIREHIFKLLFLLEFYNGYEINEQAELYMDEVEKDALTEREAGYIREKFHKIEEKIEKLDKQIADASSGWKLNRIGKVELAIMRLAVYEMKEDEEIPVGVAINEAVELAKKFGGDDSPAFINAVLAKLTD